MNKSLGLRPCLAPTNYVLPYIAPPLESWALPLPALLLPSPPTRTCGARKGEGAGAAGPSADTRVLTPCGPLSRGNPRHCTKGKRLEAQGRWVRGRAWACFSRPRLDPELLTLPAGLNAAALEAHGRVCCVAPGTSGVPVRVAAEVVLQAISKCGCVPVRVAIQCVLGAGARPAGTEGSCSLSHLWSLGNLWLQRWQGRPPMVMATVPRYSTPLSMMQVRT